MTEEKEKVVIAEGFLSVTSLKNGVDRIPVAPSEARP